MSEEGKKDALALCLPDPSVHQRSWKISIHQHLAVPPSHHDCPVGELPQVSIRSSLKETARCFWQLLETKSEQLEVSGGCFGIAQSSGFLKFPYPKEVHNRPHPNYWGAISYQCPDVSQEVLPVVFWAAFAVGMSRQKAGALALAPRSMVCTLLGPELFPWEGRLDFRTTGHSLARFLSILNLVFSLMQKSTIQWSKLNSDCEPGSELLRSFKSLKELRPNLTLWFTVLKI